MPGSDGATTASYARSLDKNLRSLRRELLDGSYQAAPLRPFTVRRDGKVRKLGLPTVRDRVAQRCVMEAFDRELEAANAEHCFAYRRGRSWLDALANVERHRELGLRWVFRGDIHRFFDSIDHESLRPLLLEAMRDEECADLVMGWVGAPIQYRRRTTPRSLGIPQGAPISPAVANVYLTQFDHAIQQRRGGTVRYADDIVVCSADLASAEAARFDIEQTLRPLQLELNWSKSYVSSFDVGFSFLGWVFFRDDGFEEDPNDRWNHPMSTARNRAAASSRGQSRPRPGSHDKRSRR